MISQTAAKITLAIVATLTTLSACSATAPTVLKADHLFAVVDKPEQASGDALISGTLDIDIDVRGCWVLRNGTQLTAVIWPSGTTLSGKQISFPGVDGTLSVGTAVQGGGGGDQSRVGYRPCVATGATVLYIADIKMSK